MKQTPDVVFFIDRCLGKKPAVALRNAGATVEIHDDHFSQTLSDVEWLTQVGERDWVVLTKDQKIGYRAEEQLAVAQANVRLFALVGGGLSGDAMAQAFVNAFEGMKRFVRGNQAPFIAKVYRSGQVKEWKNQKELVKMLSNI